jgi:hypothetical protein
MNLEQQYSRMKGDSGLAKGQKFIKSLLGVGRTMNEAYSFANNSPMVGDLRKAMG